MVLTNLLIYLVNIETMRKISNYVCYSKSPNFKYCRSLKFLCMFIDFLDLLHVQLWVSLIQESKVNFWFFLIKDKFNFQFSILRPPRSPLKPIYLLTPTGQRNSIIITHFSGSPNHIQSESECIDLSKNTAD